MGGCSSKKDQNNTQHNNNLNIKMKTDTAIVKEDNKPIEAKVVLLGDTNVGKSSISTRFCKNKFTGQYVVTIGGAYLQQKLIINNGATIKFHIWDTGGQERFRSMANLYYQDAAAAILTYDVTNEKSFESLSYWIEELSSKINQDKIVLCLAGNKCDSESNEKKVKTQVAKKFADDYNMLFFETSAKNDIGIRDLFSALGKRIYEKKNRTNTDD